MSDTNNFFEFASDDTLAGFRLIKLEVYNWGTFHNKVWEMSLKGRNCLLTGDIGSGKSTLVDAVTTLLVPANKVSYNKAAGAEYKERSLRSYVLGYYKSERSEGGYTAKPVALRDRKSYSVILGTFYNEGYKQIVTLAQVFWQKETSGQPSRFYVVSDRELSIKEHFSGFGSDISQLKKQIRLIPNTEPPFDSFPPYGAAFRRRFGLQSDQALELFHQTVSLKSVGNLTSFVREHMLEAFDSAPRIEGLISHFEDLNRAHEAVIKARTQIERLTPISENLGKSKLYNTERKRLRSCRDRLRSFFAEKKAVLLKERIQKQGMEIEKLKLKQGGLTSKRSSKLAERDDIKQAISENGGDRLESLKKDVRNLEDEKHRRLAHFEKYETLCLSVDLPSIKNADSFIDNQKRVENLLKEIKLKNAESQNLRSDAEFEIKTLKGQYNIVLDEIASLKKRRSNIDSRQIRIRGDLCSALNISENELPFVGELIMVKENQQKWEGAIERVLHSFALSILVPENLYKKVSEWVNKTHLKGRIVYYKVVSGTIQIVRDFENDILSSKVDVKPGTLFHNWLEEQLYRRFDYYCCDNLDIFMKVKKGLTAAGQVKGSASRHEKDDRHDINDRSRYVLGWTNEAKIRVLNARKIELEKAMAVIAGNLNCLQRDLDSFEDEKAKLNKLEVFTNFEDINWQPLAEQIDYFQLEIEKLEGSSNKLKSLNNSLNVLEEGLTHIEDDLDKVKSEIAKIGEQVRNYKEQLEEEEKTINEFPVSLDPLEKSLIPLIGEALGDAKLTIKNSNGQQQKVRELIQQKIDAVDRKVRNLEERIIRAMQDFRRDYTSETREFDASIDAGQDFVDLLEQLKADDLPQFEQRFKEQLNENTIREIAGFQAQLNKECRQIEERIEFINKSMSVIEYNKGRYIKLEALVSVDADIRGFRQELKSCTEGSFSGSDNEQYTEEKFMQVKTIVNRFKGREGISDLDRKWTLKVTDVRNWFAFAASERWKEDDSEYEHYTDSGGKSGGQKEKLAYTVLAASLAYQFGLEWGEVRSRSFRFVVIDEAFGRGSDESARFGLELFKQLNLQLLIITPLQKIHIIEPYVSTVGFVHNEEGKNSLLRSISIEEYREEKEINQIETG